MAVQTRAIAIETRGHTDILDLTPQVAGAVADAGLRAGTATVFVTGSTAGVTTVEFEPGLVADLQELFERLAPEGRPYRHHERWGDDNGHSHVRASLLGPSLVVPFAEGKLLLGQWQQIVLLDFDTRGRRRDLIVQIIGE